MSLLDSGRSEKLLISAILTLLSVALVYSDEVVAHDAPTNLVKQAVLDAKTWYWVGLSDKRDAGAFRAGLRYIDKAQRLLDSLVLDADVDHDKLHRDLQLQIDALRLDLEEQENLSSVAFGGHFPLVRFLGVPALIDTGSVGSFELVEDPFGISADKAGVELGKMLQGSYLDRSQIPVIVTSPDPVFAGMESMVRMMLKGYPRIKIYEPATLIPSFADEEIRAFGTGHMSESMLGRVFYKVQSDLVAIASVSMINQVDDIYFTRVVTRLYDRASTIPIETIVVYKLIRDKRGIPAVVVTYGLIALIGAMVTFAFSRRYTTGRYPSVGLVFKAVLPSFIFGVLSSQAIITLLATIRPGLHDHIGYTGWWVFLAVFTIIWIPPIVYKNTVTRIKVLRDWYDPSGRKRMLFYLVALGSSLSLSFGLFLYFPVLVALILSISTTILFGGAGYLFGSFLDDPGRRSGIPLLASVCILVPLGAYLVASGTNEILFLGVAAANLLLVPARSLRTGRYPSIDEDSTTCSPNVLSSVDDLKVVIQNPPYLETAFFRSQRDHLIGRSRDGGTVCCLLGPAGVGKTATSEALVRALSADSGTSSKPVMILYGRCDEGAAGATPYAPIQKILRDHFHINPAADQYAQMLQIDEIMEGVFGKFVPFSSLLFPPVPDSPPAANTRVEFMESILRVFEKLAERNRVVFVIDDVQWIDDATAELVRYFHENAGGDTLRDTVFLYTSRDCDRVREIFTEDEVVPVDPLDEEDRVELMVSSLAIEEDSARIVAGWTRQGQERGDNLFWLLKAVEHIVNHDGFVFESGSFKLTSNMRAATKPPIPKEYQASIRAELSEIKDSEALIAAAAAIGLEFDASVLARAIGMDELRCLVALQNLEHSTSLIYDVQEKDGVFAFSSSFSLEAIRRELGVQEAEYPDVTLKQIVKELHWRIGDVLEKENGDNEILNVAHHYYAAGDRHVDKAVTYAIKAAHFCTSVFRYEEARLFLEKARRRVRLTDKPSEYELEILLCECDISHREGSRREENAEDCRHALATAHDLTNAHLLRFARSFYDARDFETCASVAERVLDGSADDLEAAEALHFIAISHPPFAAKERVEDLTRALDRINVKTGQATERKPSTARLRLRAQILNSLGEAMATLAAEEPSYRDSAIAAFNESVEIKSDPLIQDTPGLAISYGGLGRVFLFLEPVDVDSAVRFFELDLEYSRQTGDITGQTIMYSLLGNCHLLKNNSMQAKQNYELSLSLAPNLPARFHAYFGLLRTYGSLPDDAGMNARIEEFCDLLRRESVPTNLVDMLMNFLNDPECPIDGHTKERIERVIGPFDSIR
jgi:tetratricopeptide (TPR) repeat protein